MQSVCTSVGSRNARAINFFKSGGETLQPSPSLRKLGITVLLALLGLAMTPAVFAVSDPDLPSAAQNLETIASGALVIPMDVPNQHDADDLFNLKAYGAVNKLLQNEIPVKWAIRYDKT